MRIRSSLPSSSEIEAVLIVRENSDEVLKQLAGMTSILNFRLIAKPTKVIRDTYYDTSSGRLQKKSINLRTREVDGNVLLSVKSGARMTWGGVKRKETEVPWSPSSLAMTLKALKLRALDTGTSGGFDKDPRETLLKMGLFVVQDRQTRREARNIVAERDPSRQVLAEMVIDRVTYSFDGKAVTFHEIEVESKTRDSSAMRNVTRELLANFRPSLQAWRHGKFVTGKVIEKLLREGGVEGLLSGSMLTASGFDRIDRLIRSGRV